MNAVIESSDQSSTPLLTNHADTINKPLHLTDKDKNHLISYIRKCDLQLLFYICGGYATDSLNKMALANAKISGLTKDLNMSSYETSMALGVYYLGSFLFQIPSNLILKKVRPKFWLPFSMAMWSTVTMLTVFAKTGRELILCRFLFGVVQSGYLTGCLYYISFWYPRDEVRKRTGFFFASSGLGGIIVGPLCSGLSSIDIGLRPWQNIFLFIGIISFVWSLAGPFVLGDYPDKAKFIATEERKVITRIMEHQNTIASDQKVSLQQIKMALVDYKIWLWTLIDFCANGATQVNGMFGPTIIADQGYSSQVAQALSSLTNFMAFSGMASISYLAKFVGSSGYAIMISNCVTICGFFVALFSRSVGGRLFALFVFSFASPQPAAHSPAWEMANQQGNTKPAMAAAFTSAVGGLGPLATAFVYRDQDAPGYVLGHSVCLSMTVVCLLAALVLRLVLTAENKRRDRAHGNVDGLTLEEIQDLADNHPDFRYKL